MTAAIVCSFCGVVMAEGTPGAKVSHGCCPECWPIIRAASGLKAKPYPTLPLEPSSRPLLGYQPKGVE